ncbi:MAG: amidohydrolase [Candidatus Eremiobacteraeota bacterium]|nr:amidohydrolase [Candidatus Eremiobacteraeota bacterium]
MTTIETIVPDVAERAIAIRRDIHRFPELGFEEERTAGIVECELDALGIEHRRVAKTGVVGIVRGAFPGQVAGLRADMDALPLDERSGESFSSEVAGKMHACGHDAHTAMLLGAARVLQADRANLHGTTVLLFQPAEEGPGGALPMIEAGAMDDPRIDAVAMLHVDVRLATGEIGFDAGAVNAAADEFHVTIEGRGGHGASPHTAVDAIPAAAAVVLALQNIAARETDPLATIVVTIGTIEGGYRNNIIADRVRMTGTFRTQDATIRAGLEARARRIVENVAAAYGTTGTLEVIYGYPAVVNDAALARSFRAFLAAETSLRVSTPAPTMGAEDFAYFAERAPGLLIRHGIRSDAKGSVHPGHSPLFRLDEDALAYGIATLVAFARGVGAGRVAGGHAAP